MAAALEHAVRHDIDGVYNAAADGVLVLSEIAALLGKPLAPVLAPVGTQLSAALLRRAGVPLTGELERLLRFGRAMDNRKLKATGFRYRYTTRETVLKLREHQRLAGLMRGANREGYRYERELEEFLRYSPSVRAANAAPKLPTNIPAGGEDSAAQIPRPRPASTRTPPKPAPPRPAAPPVPDYADLESEEIIALLGELDAEQLRRLREHEAGAAARQPVLGAIDSLLARA
jgi:UDP-glucose 4-epimerase